MSPASVTWAPGPVVFAFTVVLLAGVVLGYHLGRAGAVIELIFVDWAVRRVRAVAGTMPFAAAGRGWDIENPFR